MLFWVCTYSRTMSESRTRCTLRSSRCEKCPTAVTLRIGLAETLQTSNPSEPIPKLRSQHRLYNGAKNDRCIALPTAIKVVKTRRCAPVELVRYFGIWSSGASAAFVSVTSFTPKVPALTSRSSFGQERITQRWDLIHTGYAGAV